MRKSSFLLVIILLFSSLIVRSSTIDEITTLKNNLKHNLLYPDQKLQQRLQLVPPEEIFGDQMVVELSRKYAINSTEISGYLSKLNDKGFFDDN